MTATIDVSGGVGNCVAETTPENNTLSIEVLRDLCTNNAEFFATDSSENGQRLYLSFMAIKDTIESIVPKIEHIRAKAPLFDFDEKTPGNGYRSFLSTVDSAVVFAIHLNKKVCLKRDNTFFRKGTVTKDVESCAHLLSSLDTCLKHLQVMLSRSTEGNLFPTEEYPPEDLVLEYEDINQYCFYGRCMGFQFCESLKNTLQFISMAMAVFSEIYYNQGSLISRATSSVLASTKYYSDPEQRARRIVNIAQCASVDFCKSFWFLAENEFMTNVPYVVSPAVAVSRVIILQPEPLTITVHGRDIDVPVPSSHIGKRAIQVRLISYDAHQGMIGEAARGSRAKPPARGLLIHCHGGGFVAQSSLSHECYLREWAKQLKVPILSIDYSLAPEAPFPRALEEVTYAYCWALKNHDLLGSTGERIVAAGDSAGANLLLATTLKCIHLGIPTFMGIFAAYAPTWVKFIPSPARLLCMMDPLLPFGFLMRCLRAYACQDPQIDCNGVVINNCDQNSDTESFEEITESDLMELQAHKSPISETSDTLTYGSLTSNGIEDDKNVRNIDLQDIEVEDSQKYVSDFLEKYVLDSDTETDGTRINVLTQESAGSSSQTYDASLQNRMSSFLSNLRSRVGSWVSEKTAVGVDFMEKNGPFSVRSKRQLDLENPCSLADEVKFAVPRDPYLSPYCAPDEDLMRFPPVRVLTVHLDPCLDDCVMFAKRLKSVGNDVKLDLLSGLPHGFLNFSKVSEEAAQGSKKCVERILELLNLDGLPPQ